jgi:hypothetical protein
MKIVINTCYGGFGLSPEAVEKLASEGAAPSRDIPRDDPALVRVVETLGRAASDPLAQLQVVEIPDGVEWQIEEYDGVEWVAEKHRTWP